MEQTTNLAMLLNHGSFNPVHKNHVEMMKTAKETRARTEATEFSDYEEELEVDDVVCTYSVSFFLVRGLGI